MQKSAVYTVVSAGFEAACKIDSLPASHRASRLHGHGFRIKVRAALPKGWAQYEGSEVAELDQHLQTLLAPLDHRYLNDIIANPTNENIARWVRNKLPLEVDKIAVQSTASEGVDIDYGGFAHVWRRFEFEAAHQLPNVEPGHQCGRMHGHGFQVILHANHALEGAPMGVDLDELEALWQMVAPQLEFACLNDIQGLENPTSEHLCEWLWVRLKPRLAALSHVSVYETATAGCHYNGQQFRIWKDFRFESALTLDSASETSRHRRLHGHSYLARLHIQAPLDIVHGWTIDYGDVKARFKPLLAQLDHYRLNDLEGLAGVPSTAALAQWMQSRLAKCLPELDRIDCYEKTACGSVLTWAEQGPALPI